MKIKDMLFWEKDMGFAPSYDLESALDAMNISRPFSLLRSELEEVELCHTSALMFPVYFFPQMLLPLLCIPAFYIMKGQNHGQNRIYLKSSYAYDPQHEKHELIHNISKSLKTAYFKSEDSNLAKNALHFLFDKQLINKQITEINNIKYTNCHGTDEEAFLKRFSSETTLDEINKNSDILSTYLMTFSIKNHCNLEECLARNEYVKSRNSKLSTFWNKNKLKLFALYGSASILYSLSLLDIPLLLINSFNMHQLWYPLVKLESTGYWENSPILNKITSKEKLAR